MSVKKSDDLGPELPEILRVMTLDRDRRRKAGTLAPSPQPAATSRKKERLMSDVMEVKEASALEGKSIAELAAIFNEKAKALGINETKSTFSNAAAGIKAIEGLEITAAAVKAEGKGKRGKKVKVAPVVEKKAAKKPVVAAKKPAKATSAKVGKFGENPASFKGKLLALLDKNVGKKVAYAAAMKAVYDGDEAKTSALGGVIKGAQVAIENGGHGKLAVDGKGKTLTYTSKK